MTKSYRKGISEKELEFYSRQIVLQDIGYKGQLKLRDAKVCLAGLGGLGSLIAIQLATMGVGFLRLVDRDIVELSNLQRQHLYSMSLLGYPKVEAAAKRLRDMNPYVEVEPLPLSINPNNVDDIVKGMDVIVDGLDHMEPRYAINRACVEFKIPYVFGAAITTIGNVSTIVPGRTPCLECFQGNLRDEELPTCAVVGVHPSILGIVASLEVVEAGRILLGEQPRLANKLLYCDIRDMTFEEIHISRAENCPTCGSQPSKSPPSSKKELIEEVCGRSGGRAFIISPRKNLELNMGDLQEFLKKSGFDIKVRAELGITFDYEHKITASVLKSGVMVTEGIKDKKEALDFYNKILMHRRFCDSS